MRTRQEIECERCREGYFCNIHTPGPFGENTKEESWRVSVDDMFSEFPIIAGISKEMLAKELKEFIENVLSKEKSRIREEIEKMKKQPTAFPIPCPEGINGCLVFHCKMELSLENKGYNKCLEDIKEILK